MKMKLKNSLSRTVEPFEPLNEGEVRMYSCGPTVYNYAHIGNMRAFLFADFLQRTLRRVGGYKLKWVMNITNIDDKTIRDSAIGSEAWLPEMGEQTDNPLENVLKLTKFYEKAFLEDIAALGIDTNDFYAMPKATDYIEQMQELILAIAKNGYAYEADGSVYFDVSEWRKEHAYGRLHKIDFDKFVSGARIDADQYERDEVFDFALWKAKKEGEPYWDFDFFGKNIPGRPGWHIECSCMEKELLGLPFDIHTGGVDLKFPHHEDEIAQSCAGYGVDPTVFWLHNEFLQVEGEKMSKSKGNFFTLRDLLKKGVDPLDIRYLMLSAHYGSTLNFTFAGLNAAGKARAKVQEYVYELFEDKSGAKSPDVSALREKVFEALADDLRAPKALAAVFEFINENPADELSENSKRELLNFFDVFNKIFAVWKIEPRKEEKIEIPQEVLELAEKRKIAKKEKRYDEADKLREEIRAKGYAVKDTKEGYEIEKI